MSAEPAERACWSRQTWRRNRQMRACQGLLDKLKREQEVAAATSRFPATSCPVCLEDFRPPLGQEPVWAPPGAGQAADAVPSAPPLSDMEVCLLQEPAVGGVTKGWP